MPFDAGNTSKPKIKATGYGAGIGWMPKPKPTMPKIKMPKMPSLFSPEQKKANQAALKALRGIKLNYKTTKKLLTGK